MTSTMTTPPFTDLVPVSSANVIERLSKVGSLAALVKSMTPDVATQGVKKINLANPVALTAAASEALRELPSIINNAVCPSTRRKLSPEEIQALLTEREALDAIEAIIKKRKEAQKTIIFNHYDAQIDENPEYAATLDVDLEGYYVAEDSVGDPAFPKGFVRQLREGSPSLTGDRLKEQIDEQFTHKDYLAMTTEVRVLDEAKATLHLRKKPEIVSAMQLAIVPGKKTTAHTMGSPK